MDSNEPLAWNTLLEEAIRAPAGRAGRGFRLGYLDLARPSTLRVTDGAPLPAGWERWVRVDHLPGVHRLGRHLVQVQELAQSTSGMVIAVMLVVGAPAFTGLGAPGEG